MYACLILMWCEDSCVYTCSASGIMYSERKSVFKNMRDCFQYLITIVDISSLLYMMNKCVISVNHCSSFFMFCTNDVGKYPHHIRIVSFYALNLM